MEPLKFWLQIAEALTDKQPIDRRIDHLYPTSRSYCSGVSKRSTLPRPVMMACLDRLLRSEVVESVAAAIHHDHVVWICEGTRASGLSAEILLHESAMPSLSKNERHIDAAEIRSRCALGCARIAGSFARALHQDSARKSSRSFLPAAFGLLRIVRRPYLTISE
jgi:hypothetical protein